ncbi:uncharacterized protein LOC133987125 [Scomber scombrus]|uniref:uncharacterized protein LOC133987125 n=1 Tax=Scomber scombrus TaxID=13677 RepID=UPI002DDBE293|nr:uncharacterized protein LOC133987125 [Scomber scombrus]
MKIHTVLLFCVLSALQDGNILINAQIPTFTLSGSTSDFTVRCPFTRTGRTKYFCKDECKENILEMDGDSAERGRYSMKYKTTTRGSVLYVTIKKATESHSGLYRCGLDNSTDPYQFKLRVGDASSTHDRNSEPKLTPDTMAPPPKPTQSFRGSPTPSLSNTTEMTTGDPSVYHTTSNLDFTSDSPSTTQSFRGSPTPSSSSKTTNRQQNDTTIGGNILYVIVSVTVVVVLLVVFLPLLYKWKKRKSSSDLSSRVYLTNMESVIYENSAPVSTLEESGYENVNPSSTYETLNPTTMAHDLYSTLGQQI